MGGTRYSIETTDLSKTYHGHDVLQGLDLKVPKGEFMGILGPNGAGKSTALKIITGLIRPSRGAAYVNGIDVSRDIRGALYNVGCIVETPCFRDASTPFEVLTYIGRLRGMKKAELDIRIRDSLETVGMWESRLDRIGEFSKGMRQRIGLAQVLLTDPEIIILDEPTSGLDPRGIVEMRNVLAGLNDGNRSLLISTHMLKEVSELCGHVAMLRSGTCIARGPVAEMVNHVAQSSDALTITFRTLEENTPSMLSDISAAAGVDAVERVSANEFRLSFSGTREQQADLIGVVGSCGLRVLSMAESGADLESLYMKLTDDQEDDDYE